MMIRFNTMDELRTFLRADRDSVSLNPIRFINVDSMVMWIEVKKLLLSMSKTPVYLSSFCSEDDTTPNMRRLMASVKETTDTICISPLSEYLRVNPDIAKTTIEDVLSKEYPGNTDGKLRIYIPMYRMKSVFQTMTDSDPRKKDCVIFLDTGEESDYSLTIIQKDLDVNLSGNEIFGFQKYLQYWEQNPDKPLILHTSNAIHFGQNVFFDNVKVIVTSFDLLKSYFNLPAQFHKENGSAHFWDQLTSIITKEKTFESACCSILLINRFTSKLFDNWETYSRFQQWILWMWARKKQPTGYLGVCVNESKSCEDFIELLLLRHIQFLSSKLFINYYAERKALLLSMKIAPSEAFWEAVNCLEVLDKLRVVTDISLKERTEIFTALCEIPSKQIKDALDILATTYPKLANYLITNENVEIEGLPETISDYLIEYRWNKAANIIPSSFVDRVRSFAVEHGASVYAMKSRNAIVGEEYDDTSGIVFVDGMGIEYANYLASALQKLSKNSFRIRAGYCNLPSTTSENKDFMDGRRVVIYASDLDKMKDGGNQYPRSIEQELDFLDSIVEKINYEFSGGVTRIILTSDHGSSRMAVLIRNTSLDKKYNAGERQIYKYGRFCDGVDLAEQFETGIECKDKDGHDRLVFADYSRFAQNGAPVDEIHGGASIEEWIVPVVIIDKTDVRKPKLSVVIVAPTLALRADSMTGMVTVDFSLKGYSDNDVSVRVHGKKIECKRSGSAYSFKYLPNKAETSVKVSVYISNNSIGEFKFDIKQGIAKNDKFDL